MTEKLRYTVFDINEVPCDDCGSERCITLPNDPRKSLDGTKGIATGVFENAPGAVFLTQKETEQLMQTPEWTSPEPDHQETTE